MAAIHNCWYFQTGFPFECHSSKFLAKMNHEKWKGWRSHLNHLSETIHTNVKAYRKPSLKSLWKKHLLSHGCFRTKRNNDKIFQPKNCVLLSMPKINLHDDISCIYTNSTMIYHAFIMYIHIYMYMYMVSQPFPSRNPQNPLRKNTQLIRVRLVKVRNTVEGQIDLTTKWPSVGPGGLPLFGEAYFQGQKRGNLLRDFLRMFFWLVVSWYQWVSRIVCVYIYINKLDVAKWNLVTVQLMTYHLQLGIFLCFFSTLLTEGIEFHFDFQRSQFVIRDYLGWYLQTSLGETTTVTERSLIGEKVGEVRKVSKSLYIQQLNSLCKKKTWLLPYPS